MGISRRAALQGTDHQAETAHQIDALRSVRRVLLDPVERHAEL
jgi:hypothetical protein